ncbi:hypothetical protein [Thermoplasma sp. Kam2015]|uniref:hypothetical protein n=1 Tax=Thermoplasma sp. Kam2015 TaxID=2094122 RepID=UPI00129403B4|nr:hypothetical protein [Thermoplasma sp. Kam2015]
MDDTLVKSLRSEYTPVEIATSVTLLPDVVRKKVSNDGKLRSGSMGIEFDR